MVVYEEESMAAMQCLYSLDVLPISCVYSGRLRFPCYKAIAF